MAASTVASAGVISRLQLRSGVTPYLRSTPPLASRPAFTLIELLVVLVIVGLVASLTAVSLSRVTAANTTERSLARLVDTLSAARIDAIANRGPVVVRLFDEQATPPDELQSPHNDRRWRAESAALTHPEGVRSQLERDGVAEIGFGSDGRASVDALAFTSFSADTTSEASGADRWTIRFDPIDGRPSLRRGPPGQTDRPTDRP